MPPVSASASGIKSASQEPASSLTQSNTAAKRKPGRPSKYATEEERQAAERARKKKAREEKKAKKVDVSNVSRAGVQPGDAGLDGDEGEEGMARYANDYGHVKPPDPEAINAVQVVINFMKEPGRYASWRKSSPAGKGKVVREIQGEMQRRGMQSARRDPKAVLAQIRKLVRDCVEANAFENSTGEGLTERDRIWLEAKRLDGAVEEDESDLKAYMRLKWPYWDEMRSVLAGRAALNPPDTFDSGLEVDDNDLDAFARSEEGDTDEILEDDTSVSAMQEEEHRKYDSLFNMLDSDDNDDHEKEDDENDEDGDDEDVILSVGQQERPPISSSRHRVSSDSSSTVNRESDGTTRPRAGNSRPPTKRGAGNNGSAMNAIAESQRQKSQTMAAMLKRQDQREKEWLSMERSRLKKEASRLEDEKKRADEESYHRCLKIYTECLQTYERETAGRMAFRDKWEKEKAYLP